MPSIAQAPISLIRLYRSPLFARLCKFMFVIPPAPGATLLAGNCLFLLFQRFRGQLLPLELLIPINSYTFDVGRLSTHCRPLWDCRAHELAGSLCFHFLVFRGEPATFAPWVDLSHTGTRVASRLSLSWACLYRSQDSDGCCVDSDNRVSFLIDLWF